MSRDEKKARFYKEFINELKANVKIEDEVARFVTLTRKGGKLSGLCPFHEEKTPSFFVFPDKGSYHCFGCGAGGDVISFVEQIENADFNSAVEIIAKRNGVTVPAETGSKNDPRGRLFRANEKAEEYFVNCLSDPRFCDRVTRALTDRGVSEETIEKFSLGYAPDNKRLFLKAMYDSFISKKDLEEAGLIWCVEGKARCWFADRIMIPIRDERGRIVGFGGRSVSDKTRSPKYLNTTETEIFKKSKVLFGIDVAKRSRRDDFILCEGYFDAIMLHQNGYDNAVATMGVSLTDEHIEILRKYKRSVTLCYDSDEAGTVGTARAAKLLKSRGIKVRVARLRPYKDPDEALRNDAESFSRMYSSAADFDRYVIDRTLEMKTLDDDCEKKIECAHRCA